MPAKASWSPLVHHVYRALKAAGVGAASRRREMDASPAPETPPRQSTAPREGEAHAAPPFRAGVAVSGGRDSALLLEVLAELAPALHLELHVLHVHHGPPPAAATAPDGPPPAAAADAAEDPQSRHRAEAEALVRARAAHHGLPCHVTRASTPLASEEELRDFRRAAFQEIRARESLEAVFLGHHAQDLLETRLMRLIRGTGGQGLEAMREDERPFLSCTPEELAHEAAARGLAWVEDPSNRDSRYFRNWLRHEWLPQLEAKSPGALRSFARSCANWAEAERSRDEQFPPEGLFLNASTLSQPVYWRLGPAEQRRALAHLVHDLKGADYSRSQLEEIRKRLDKSQNEYTFDVAGLAFRVTKRGIEASSAE